MNWREIACWLAQRAAEFWDFVDKRDVDKHAMAWGTFAYTIYLVDWCLEYAFRYPDKSGVELGLVIAATLLPWTPVQGYVLKWYFERQSS